MTWGCRRSGKQGSVITAISNNGCRWPRTRTTITLAPADVRKEGPSFDLPIAVTNGEEIPRLDRCMVTGDLALKVPTGDRVRRKFNLPIEFPQ